MAEPQQMVRLDQLLVDRGHCRSLSEAAALVMSGKVLIGDNVVDKVGTLVPSNTTLRIKDSRPFVSRGGIKLRGGLDYYSIDPQGWICVDIGASTGGFTDCLLQAGAARVYAVDVAYGILDWKIRSDSRVVVLERCNARHLGKEHIGEAVDFCVFDTSFISLTKLLPPVLPLFGKNKIRILCLVKPQFELDRSALGSGGIVSDESLRIQAVEKVVNFSSNLGLVNHGFSESAIKGAKGNQEYLLYLTGE